VTPTNFDAIAMGGSAPSKQSIAVVLQKNGYQNVYYVRANSQVYNWYFAGPAGWSNAQLSTSRSSPRPHCPLLIRRRHLSCPVFWGGPWGSGVSGMQTIEVNGFQNI